MWRGLLKLNLFKKGPLFLVDCF
ncbi:unnamed protein product, partial [Vitis vinifera]|uniref:Uncharacterized protein n=1 Tax=Vitis vinifera TaxID=29760 RepID=D7TPU0_VITVI